MGNPIVHFEIMGEDGEAQNAFYSNVFGWKTEAVPGFDAYYLTQADDTGVGGAVGKGGDPMATYLTLYIQVDDVDEHLRTIEAAGGKTLMPKTVVPGTVTFAWFADPAGNAVGIVEAETPPAE